MEQMQTIEPVITANVANGFRKTGIYPEDRKDILDTPGTRINNVASNLWWNQEIAWDLKKWNPALC